MNEQKCPNKLCERLLNGKSSIHGMIMLFPIEPCKAVIRVKVQGIVFTQHYRNECRVRVSPTDGVGFFDVSPTELLDDTTEAVEVYRFRSEALMFQRAQTPTTSSDRAWRTCVIHHREKSLTDEQRARFDHWWKKRFGDHDAAQAIKKSSDWALRPALEALSQIKWNLDLNGAPLETE